METTTTQPSPAVILQIGTGFWASKVLLTAVQFELFTHLVKQPNQTIKDIKSKLDLKCTDRNAYDFLDCLVGLGFLNREGILETAHYSNTIDTAIFLDKAKPSYIGGILEMQNEQGWNVWAKLDRGLKTGLIQHDVKDNDENIFDFISNKPEMFKKFVDGMTGVQMGNFIALAQKFDFSNYKTLLDAGGSAGVLSIMIAQHNTHMNCTTFDLPALESMANETIEKFKMADHVKVLNGDFFKDELPKADIVTMGNVLHDWDEDTKIKLMKTAYDALPKGGVFIAIEHVIDNERKQNVFGLMMSLNMLIETGDGFNYTFDDFNNWAKKAGFSSTELMPLAGPSSAAIAYKQ
ncbi:MAG TPA: methyltransferase [Leeuwenhoekiella sp.]|nr:methyltransferase [Leeuwenhoekiella sp.]